MALPDAPAVCHSEAAGAAAAAAAFALEVAVAATIAGARFRVHELAAAGTVVELPVVVDTETGVTIGATGVVGSAAAGPDEAAECALIACENEAVFHTEEVTVDAGACWEAGGDLRGVQSSSGSTG